MPVKNIAITLCIVFFCSSPAIASDASKDEHTMKTFMQSDIVKKFHKSAYGYAVFPTIGKGGLGVGVAHGNGRVYRDGQKSGNVDMTEVSVGFQLGGQAYSQLIYFQDERAYKEFTKGNFEFSAQAEAIAITASVGAQAGTDGSSASTNSAQGETGYYKGMVVFTVGKGGLMYQAALGGQKYNFTASK